MQLSSKLLFRTAVVLLGLMLVAIAFVAVNSQKADALSSGQWTTVRNAVKGYIASQVQYSADGEAGFTIDRTTLKGRIDSNGDMSPTGTVGPTAVTGVLGEGDNAANAPVVVDNLFTTANVIPGSSVRCNWNGSYGTANCFDSAKVSEIAGRVNAHEAAGFSTDIVVYCATGRTEAATVGGLGPLAQTGALGGSSTPKVLAYKWGRNGWTGSNTTTSATTGATGAGTAPGSWVGYDSNPTPCNSYSTAADVVRCTAQWAIVSGAGDPAWGGSGYNHSNGITTAPTTSQQVIDIRTPSPATTMQVAGAPTTRKIPIEHLFDSQLGYMTLGTSSAKNVIVGRTMHLPLIASMGAVMLGYDSTAYVWGVNSWNTSLGGESYQTGGLDTPLYPTQTATGSSATSGIDQTAPTVTVAPSVSGVTTSSAIISRTTNEPATMKVEYGTTSGGPYTNTVNNTVLNASKSVTLSGLSEYTTYYYKVTSYDGQANGTVSAEGSFTTADGTNPSITNILPSGTITTGSTTVSANFSDSGSGINTATAMIHVDGPMLGGCAVTATSISCPKSGLSLGSHSIQVWVDDNAGNTGYATGSFTVADATPPSVTYSGPSGTVSVSNPTVTGSATDAAPSSGLASAKLNLNAGPNITCTIISGSISCPTSGLADGPYSAVITVTDVAGNSGTASGSFTVSTCTAGKPSLKMMAPAPFWASYADYVAKKLSVTWTINNIGATNAYNVAITSSTPTYAPITCITPMPAAVGNIAASGSGSVVLKYQLPLNFGGAGFRVINTASAQDCAGNSYTYP